MSWNRRVSQQRLCQDDPAARSRLCLEILLEPGQRFGPGRLRGLRAVALPGIVMEYREREGPYNRRVSTPAEAWTPRTCDGSCHTEG